MIRIINTLILIIISYVIIDYYFFYEPKTDTSDFYQKIKKAKISKTKKKKPVSKREAFKNIQVIDPELENQKQESTQFITQQKPHTMMQDKTGRIYPNHAEVQDEYIVVMGDIVAGHISDIEEYRQGNKPLFIGAPLLWPNNTIFYRVSPKLKRSNRYAVEKAIEEFEKKTNLKFIKRSDQEDYVSFERADLNCYSKVGLQGGKQVIGVSKGCGKPQILHELMHTIGFFHEQNRPDRDKYIRILYENIEEEYWTQFDKISIWAHEEPTFPFSFDTIMLYNSTYFRREGTEDYSMVTIQGDPFLHEYQSLTETDIKRINILYPKS